MRHVFLTGATGYIGRPLLEELLRRGHGVTALVRPGSESRLARGCDVVLGDALEPAYAPAVCGSDTFVHLVGVARPNPLKTASFRAIDLASIRAAVECAGLAGVSHFIYVSVAQPAPVMRAYIAVRREGERLIRESGLNATILRPWYVLGPGRRWPVMLTPLYRAAEALPAVREGARRLGLIALPDVIRALAVAVENPCSGVRVLDVPAIRAAV